MNIKRKALSILFSCLLGSFLFLTTVSAAPNYGTIAQYVANLIQNNHYLIDKDFREVYFLEILLNTNRYGVNIISYEVPIAFSTTYPSQNNSHVTLPSSSFNPQLKMVKELLTKNGSEIDLKKAQERESELLRECWKTEEHKEAVKKFLTKSS